MNLIKYKNDPTGYSDVVGNLPNKANYTGLYKSREYTADSDWIKFPENKKKVILKSFILGFTDEFVENKILVMNFLNAFEMFGGCLSIFSIFGGALVALLGTPFYELSLARAF